MVAYLDHGDEGLDEARKNAEEELCKMGATRRVIIDDDNADYFDAGGVLIGHLDFNRLRMLHQLFGG